MLCKNVSMSLPDFSWSEIFRIGLIRYEIIKLIRYYGKARNFNSIGLCEETRKFKLFLQFMQCSLYNDFLHIRYGDSIHFKPILWKNCFLPKRNIYTSHLPEIRSKFLNQQKQLSGVFCKNCVLRNFAHKKRPVPETIF